PLPHVGYLHHTRILPVLGQRAKMPLLRLGQSRQATLLLRRLIRFADASRASKFGGIRKVY
ncbi:MAG: hypothetical protein ACHQ7M_13575, partial [Chloroflexota bacterium]